MTLFGSLEIARNSLLAHQEALNTTGHNITNINTEGYTRQTINLSTQVPTLEYYGYSGSGVKVDNVIRVYNSFIEQQIQRETSTLNYYRSLSEFYEEIENILNEFHGSSVSSVSGTAEDSLSGIIDQFWASWQDVANNPEDMSSRAALVVQGEVLTQSISLIYTNLEEMELELNNKVPTYVDDINRLASEVAELNAQILYPEKAGLNPNDLKDRRDSIIKEISKYIDISTLEDDNGIVSVLVGGDVLVQGDYTKEIEYYNDEGSTGDYLLRWKNTNFPINITDGKLKAVIDTRDVVLNELKEQFNELAATLIDEVNTLHRTGIGLDGSSSITGAISFTGTLETDATIAINDVTINLSAGDNLAAIRDKINIQTASHGIQASIDANNRLVLSPIDTNYNVNITDDPNEVMLNLGIINNFFNTYSDASSAAATISVSSIILSDNLKIAASSNGAPGNNAVALALANLQNTATMSNSAVTFADYYQGMVVGIGSDTAKIAELESNQELLLSKITQQRESQSGVSLDDELTNILKYQKGYQASAKVLTTVDEMINTILGLKR